MKIPLCIPYLGEEEIVLVKEVLNSGWLAHGPKNKEFEERFAEYIGTQYAVSLNSCTSALQLSIIANDLKGEIIVPSFTFVASANAIVTADCKPVFADIEFDSCNINPEKIREKITNKTVAIMPVHFAGQSCKMDELMEIAQKNDLVVIEDSAEALGAEFNNKKTGSFGIGCFSFYPTKNITTGEGGLVTTDSEEIANRIKALRGHGIETSTFEREKVKAPWIRAATYAGYNYRLSDILAALGVAQMKKINEMNSKRIENSKYLSELLKDVEDIELPIEMKKCKHVYQMYAIKVDAKKRDDFVNKLRAREIGASVHFYPAVHEQPYYKSYDSKNLEITEEVSRRIITLPMYPQLKKEEIEYIADSVKEILEE